MVAGCPKCNARYRVNAERIGPDGAKLRCTKCSAVFLVRTPQGSPEPPPVAPEPSPVPDSEIDSERLVLVADPDEARGNSITAREILDKGAETIREDLHDQPHVQGRLMRTMGEVYRKLGLYDAARPLQQASPVICENQCVVSGSF